MLVERIVFSFFFLHLVNPQLQINLYLTDWESEDEDFQHDCLYVPAPIKNESDPHQIISYCMSEWPSKFHITQNKIDQNFTFDDLSKENITSEQLYLWSASMDLIEEYQFYLNQLQNSEKTSLGRKIFYNCTLPYFGSQCQYVLFDFKSSRLSLAEIIDNYYYYNRYEPTLLTCYMHLECNRGPFPSCLDWSEICDGKVDCLDGGYDEEYCWQLEIHQCNDNEYQCSNGQCIPQSFYHDDRNTPDCLDQSDTARHSLFVNSDVFVMEQPSFRSEDIICSKAYFEFYNFFSLHSCLRERNNLLLQAMFSIKPNMLSNECWTAMKGIIQMPNFVSEICRELCSDKVCDKLIQKTCPDLIIVPAVPVIFGHVYLAYNKTRAYVISFRPTYPQYACYNDHLLHLPIDNEMLPRFNNTTCRYPPNARYASIQKGENWDYYIRETYRSLWKFQSSSSSYPEICNGSNMYHCINSSKCISQSRLYDGVIDCSYEDDEGRLVTEDNEVILFLGKNCSTTQTPNYFRCVSTNECIPRDLVQNDRCDCTPFESLICDDEYLDLSYARNTISFQTICDGYTHLFPKLLEGENETDETNCEHWPSIHIYNRCDGFWNILNGSDELDCDPSPLLNCSVNDHICVSSTTNELICLPIEKANDRIIDCLGAADEPALCRSQRDENYSNRQKFLCENDDRQSCITAEDLCDGIVECPHGRDDERACKTNDIIKSIKYGGICTENYESLGSDIAKILCRHFSNTGERGRVYFTLDQRRNATNENVKEEKMLRDQPLNQSIQSYQQRCHRGLDLQVWLDKEKNLTTNVCLCPSNYYGDTCQYQNQRISLTLQIVVTSDSLEIPFLIIISLIDNSNERIIHSSEQLTYLSIKHCQRKSNMYLLYSRRPKDQMKEYLIHIDIYEKKTLDYRGSVIKSLNFPFLPVHRLAFQLDIPDYTERCSDDQCINGKCLIYSNDPRNRTYCQCEKGWSGKSCTIEYHCRCSSDSLCLGKLANNRSLCICPWNKMGPRCLMNDNICQNNKSVRCYNNGQCISVDEYRTSTKRFVCICLNGFSGDQCEIEQTKLVLSFDKNINLSSSIFVHFIEVNLNAPPIRTTTFKVISFGQDTVSIYWSLPFHLTFVQLTNESYYLIVVQKIHKQSSRMEKRINSSDRCWNIKELFNATIANLSLLRRIKYYHIPCQRNSSQVSCFYDERHLCLCQQVKEQYVANCFEFDHKMKLYCSGPNGCKNGGTCFQENTNCPRISICQCPVCHYGRRCQLSTSGFSLSLDAILGYHISPNLNISRQPYAILISLIIALLITLSGLANGILSIITFKNKSTRESGCGIYLFTSSVVTLLTMIIFLLKFLILLFSQMGSIQNRLFLKVQCHSIDYLLRSSLIIDQWLTAFVAIERIFIVIKGVNFNKKKSKFIAKRIIIGLVLLTLVTNIFDPIYRSLFEENANDEEEKRIWCIVEYPSTVYLLNLMIHIFHFIVPFIINFISAIVIIVKSAQQQATVQKKQKYQEILKKQIQQHKNLLIGPFVLILLGIPRLIISFTSGCMKSSKDSWLFLLGYFISLIPPLLTFILFVLPSTIYKQAFRKAISRYRNIIRRR